MGKKLIKKWSLIILLLGVVFIGLGAKCPFKGKDGRSGSSGEDALISSNSYWFTPVGNPYTKVIPEITLTGLEAGWQTVTVYSWDAGSDSWMELPLTFDNGVNIYGHFTFVGDGWVGVETYMDGVLYVGDAVQGSLCMATVQTFND